MPLIDEIAKDLWRANFRTCVDLATIHPLEKCIGLWTHICNNIGNQILPIMWRPISYPISFARRYKHFCMALADLHRSDSITEKVLLFLALECATLHKSISKNLILDDFVVFITSVDEMDNID
jgi:hypothetical protein